MMSRRWWNTVAFALVSGALLLLIVFHLTPAFEYRIGWEVWVEVASLLSDPGLMVRDTEAMVVIPGLVTATLLLAGTPWLVPLLGKSRVLWWIMVLLSVATCVCLSGYLILEEIRYPGTIEWNTGSRCLLLAPIAHFAGLLMIRGEKKPTSGLAAR